MLLVFPPAAAQQQCSSSGGCSSRREQLEERLCSSLPHDHWRPLLSRRRCSLEGAATEEAEDYTFSSTTRSFADSSSPSLRNSSSSSETTGAAAELHQHSSSALDEHPREPLGGDFLVQQQQPRVRRNSSRSSAFIEQQPSLSSKHCFLLLHAAGALHDETGKQKEGRKRRKTQPFRSSNTPHIHRYFYTATIAEQLESSALLLLLLR